MIERNAKREQFNNKQPARSRIVLPAVLVVLALAAAGGWLLFGSQSHGGHAVVAAGQDGMIRLAQQDFADGKARFYRFSGTSGPIDFFVVRSQDGIVRAAFDTCDVCYREHKGYRQEGNDMVCNNCDQHFRTDLVNVVKGGCNPAPLERRSEGDKIIIAVNDLARGAGYFQTATN